MQTVVNPLSNSIFIVSTDPDVVNMLQSDPVKYSWLIDLQSNKKEPKEPVDAEANNNNNNNNQSMEELVAYKDYLDTVKNFITTNGGQSYYTICSDKYRQTTKLTAPSLLEKKLKLDCYVNKVVVAFTDYNNNQCNHTKECILLYNAVKNGDIETVKNMTINADPKTALHLCIKTASTNLTPLDIAIKYAQIELIPVLIDIINKQAVIKKKKKSCEVDNKVIKSKRYLNNKKLCKKSCSDNELVAQLVAQEDDLELYEELNIEEINPLAICNVSLEDVFKENYISYCIQTEQHKSLLALLDTENPIIEKQFMDQINSLLVTCCTKQNMFDLLRTVLNCYTKISTKYDLVAEYTKIAPKSFKDMLLANTSREALEFLLDECNKIWTIKDKIDGENILHQMILPDKSITNKAKYTELIKRIIELYPESVNETDKLGCTPIMKAVVDHADLFFETVVDKSNLTRLYDNDYNILHKVVELGRVKMFKTLVVDCDIDAQTKLKAQTVLMVAIKFGRLYMAQYLLKLEANQDKVDVFGNTALHYAMQYHSYPLVNALTYHTRENYFRLCPYDYVLNSMKSFFHHTRNKKLEKTFSPIQLRYIVAIYNKFIKTVEPRTRQFATDEEIKDANKYIFDQLRTIKGDQVDIPPQLKL